MNLASQLPEKYVNESHLDVCTPFRHDIKLVGFLKNQSYSLLRLIVSMVGCMGWLALLLVIASRRLADVTPIWEFPAGQAGYLTLGSLIGLVVLPGLARFVILLLVNAHPRICLTSSTILQITYREMYFTRPQFWLVTMAPYVMETCLAVALLLVQPVFFALPVMIGGGLVIFFAFMNRIPRLVWTLTHPPEYLYSENQCDKVDAYSPRVQDSSHT